MIAGQVTEAALRAPLVLASASPRRQEILRLAGIAFEVAVSDAEAGLGKHPDPRRIAAAGARAKALDVAKRFSDRVVVGADTVVALGRDVLEKPGGADEAAEMLRRLSGREHTVYTACALALGAMEQLLAEDLVASAVTFRRLTEGEIAAYVATGDPLDKAGAYGIQSAGAPLVAAVIGSYLNVVGLPLARLRCLLADVGWTGPA